MADWFLARGLDPTRLIVEKRALTTGQNAQYTCEILTGQYPQARNLLLVTSGYHMRMSCLLYTAEAILYEYAFGAQPYAIAGHVACEVLGPDEYNGTAKQAQYLWTLADPQY